ncbi:MAG: hypothetical protein V4550_19960 [Gemmatimonadota bacterium]
MRAPNRIGTSVLFLAVVWSPCAVAQTGYLNSDGGRPVRTQDALVTARRSLDLELPAIRGERFGSGVTRWRVDPEVTYGVAPFTELAIRVPVLYVVPPPGSGERTSGVAGVAVSGLHAFGQETSRKPAVALGTEILLATGSLASPRSTYSAFAAATKTLPVARVHLNAGIGTWSVRATPPPEVCIASRFSPVDTPSCGGPLIPDIPCDVIKLDSLSVARFPIARSSVCLGPSANQTAAEAPRSDGMRWSAAIGTDHAFALSSTQIAVDVVADRFVGLYAVTDLTAEVGARHQLSPRVVLDAGVSRKFAGAIQSTAFTVGGTFAFSLAR